MQLEFFLGSNVNMNFLTTRIPFFVDMINLHRLKTGNFPRAEMSILSYCVCLFFNREVAVEWPPVLLQSILDWGILFSLK